MDGWIDACVVFVFVCACLDREENGLTRTLHKTVLPLAEFTSVFLPLDQKLDMAEQNKTSGF